MVCVRTPTGKILRISVVIPDSSSRVVRELAAIEHEPLPLVRVYFKDIQLKHDLTPVDAAHGREPDYQALTMETAIQVIKATLRFCIAWMVYSNRIPWPPLLALDICLQAGVKRIRL